jgi:hypothetical protein
VRRTIRDRPPRSKGRLAAHRQYRGGAQEGPKSGPRAAQERPKSGPRAAQERQTHRELKPTLSALIQKMGISCTISGNSHRVYRCSSRRHGICEPIENYRSSIRKIREVRVKSQIEDTRRCWSLCKPCNQSTAPDRQMLFWRSYLQGVFGVAVVPAWFTLTRRYLPEIASYLK